MCNDCKSILKITDYTKTINGNPLVRTYEGTQEEMVAMFKEDFKKTLVRETKEGEGK